MNEERRREERQPSFRSVELIARDAGGNETRFPIMVRDRSDIGSGGVYVGTEPLDVAAEYSLDDPESGVVKIRMVWIKKVADYVSLVGFQTTEG